MSKEHFMKSSATAICGWPWSNETANADVIERGEVENWLKKDKSKVTCKSCLKEIEKKI